MKKLVVMMLLTWMGTAAFAQEGKKLATSPELNKITALTELAGKINVAEANMATMSRTGAAEARKEVNALYASYSKELANQKSIHAADKKIVAAIAEEEKFVNVQTK